MNQLYMSFKFSFVPLFLILVLSSLSLVSSDCNQNDRNTLLKIKMYFNNPGVMSSWDPQTDCCSFWTGVECRPNGDADETDRVMRIILPGGDLSGPIPSLFGDLPNLIQLYIADCPDLSGPIPHSLTKLSSLQSLTLRNVGLSGPIPPFLCDISSLERIDLSNNSLTAAIPACFRTSYIFLDLSRNQLTGPIPPSFANVDIGTIVLSRNSLVGDASFLFGEKRNTQWIDLSWNRLEFDMSNVSFPLRLMHLDVSHNKIRGGIAREVSKLGKLEAFDVSYNRLCGPIPTAGFIKQFNATFFEHNKCLCGGPLPPCHH